MKTERVRGVMIETGSWGREYPFSLHPRLLAAPRLYYKEQILPWLDRGVKHMLWHRPWGETTIGDLGQDYDVFNYHLTEPDGNRQFALDMARILFDLESRCELTIYVGAIWQTRMKRLLEAGELVEWSRRFWSQLRMFQRSRFAFDGSASDKHMSDLERVAVQIAHGGLPKGCDG
jgi:hypothetical protein